MQRKRLKRLEILLPEDHLIWSFAPGCRGPIIRAHLNLLPALEAQTKLLEKILRRLEALDEHLSRLEAGGVRTGPDGAGEGFDAAGFFAAFE